MSKAFHYPQSKYPAFGVNSTEARDLSANFLQIDQRALRPDRRSSSNQNKFVLYMAIERHAAPIRVACYCRKER